jgi:hypothetical protein
MLQHGEKKTERVALFPIGWKLFHADFFFTQLFKHFEKRWECGDFPQSLDYSSHGSVKISL